MISPPPPILVVFSTDSTSHYSKKFLGILSNHARLINSICVILGSHFNSNLHFLSICLKWLTSFINSCFFGLRHEKTNSFIFFHIFFFLFCLCNIVKVKWKWNLENPNIVILVHFWWHLWKTVMQHIKRCNFATVDFCSYKW